MKVASLETVKKIRPDMEGARDVFKQVPVSREDGAPNFSFRVFTIMPGGHTPFHLHPFEHANYIISGRGALVTESGDEINIKAGDFALVLPDEKHQYKNASPDEPLVIICAVPKEYE